MTLAGTMSSTPSDALHVECNLIFLDGFLQSGKQGRLRKRRPIVPSWPIRLPVMPGDWGLVISGRTALDRDHLQEVYPGGDLIIVDEYELDGLLEIVQLREFPGTVSAHLELPIPGLTLDPSANAVTKLLFSLRLRDPRLFYPRILGMVADPRDNLGANETLRVKFCEMITGKLAEAFDANINLWSHPDIRERMGPIMQTMDKMLESFGLESTKIYASRQLPPALPNLVSEYRQAELNLLKGIQRDPAIPNPLGLQAAHITDIRITSERLGGGAGLFELSKNAQFIDPCLSWFQSLQPLPASSIEFLKSVRDGAISARDVDFASRIVLSSFKNPLLGIGEWANPEGDVESAELFQIANQILAAGPTAQTGTP